ncbi:putative biotin--acetyl-CoA-carboxylase ligase [Magnetofaba australis IT-1]|uniref:Bifunctional ligase/repressor BirA n=1 Tax=Magnetofaba australis IT-1 TaxID=1434232 RepID=A0A1Y2K861_9PROT|nr:putative biotin--acetyl-CoA-carboxylase ligase [Magnetofaba australis IT-1]
MSRAAVWKRIERLRGAGFEIESLPGRGYRLLREADAPTASRMAELLREAGPFLPQRYYYFPTIDSTNAEAARLARAGAPAGTLCCADAQSAGRGRLDRRWISPPGRHLYFSAVLRPAISPRYAAQLTLMAGLAIGEALNDLGVTGLAIKWPNDILLDGRKVAGILTEMAAQPERVDHVIVGVGVNVHGGAADFPAGLNVPPATLDEHTGRRWDRAELLAAIVRAIARWDQRYADGGFAAIREPWLARSQICGKRVAIHLESGSFTGCATDLDADGFLLVIADGEQVARRVLAGDVNLLSE